jgi:hypothetical protein
MEMSVKSTMVAFFIVFLMTKTTLTLDILALEKDLGDSFLRWIFSHKNGREHLKKIFHSRQKIIDRVQWHLNRLNHLTQRINKAYKDFQFYQKHRDKLEKHTLEDFARRSGRYAGSSVTP